MECYMGYWIEEIERSLSSVGLSIYHYAIYKSRFQLPTIFCNVAPERLPIICLDPSPIAIFLALTRPWPSKIIICWLLSPTLIFSMVYVCVGKVCSLAWLSKAQSIRCVELVWVVLINSESSLCRASCWVELPELVRVPRICSCSRTTDSPSNFVDFSSIKRAAFWRRISLLRVSIDDLPGS